METYIILDSKKIDNINNTHKQYKNIIYYYKNKKKEILNDKQIIKLNISNVKYVKPGCMYKEIYKSSNDKYFDHYTILKDKYSGLNEIWIEQTKLYKKRSVKIEKPIVEIKKNVSNIITFDI